MQTLLHLSPWLLWNKILYGSVVGSSIMSRDIFRVNESFHLQWPLRVLQAITQAFVSAERGRFDFVRVGLLPFRDASREDRLMRIRDVQDGRYGRKICRTQVGNHQPLKKNINWSTLNWLVSAELFHQEQRDVASCGTDIK